MTVTTLSHNTCNSIPSTRLYIHFTFLGQQNSCWEVGVFPGWSPVQCWLNLVTSGESSYPQHLWYKLTLGISSCFPPRFSLCPDKNVESIVYTTIGVTRSLSQKAPTLKIEHSWGVWYVCYVLSSKTMETFTYFSTRNGILPKYWHSCTVLLLTWIKKRLVRDKNRVMTFASFQNSLTFPWHIDQIFSPAKLFYFQSKKKTKILLISMRSNFTVHPGCSKGNNLTVNKNAFQ